MGILRQETKIEIDNLAAGVRTEDNKASIKWDDTADKRQDNEADIEKDNKAGIERDD